MPTLANSKHFGYSRIIFTPEAILIGIAGMMFLGKGKRDISIFILLWSVASYSPWADPEASSEAGVKGHRMLENKVKSSLHRVHKTQEGSNSLGESTQHIFVLNKSQHHRPGFYFSLWLACKSRAQEYFIYRTPSINIVWARLHLESFCTRNVSATLVYFV